MGFDCSDGLEQQSDNVFVLRQRQFQIARIALHQARPDTQFFNR